jgi:hypothetical protein
VIACLHAAAPDRWVLVAVGITAAIVIAWLVHALTRPSADKRLLDRLEADALDPLKRWAQSAFLVVTGNCDYGHLARGEGRRLLANWWEVHGRSDLLEVLRGLADAGRPDNAWDLLRFMLVARLAVAAGWIADDDSWSRIRPIAQRLQAAYPDWDAMAQAYVMARRQHRELALDGSEDDGTMAAIRDNIAHLHQGRWREISFDEELG